MAFTIASACFGFIASGFSQRIILPALAAARACSSVEVVGRGDVDRRRCRRGRRVSSSRFRWTGSPTLGELLHLGFVAAADGLRDDFIAGGEEVVDLMKGVAVGAAHEAVADEADAELFLWHRKGGGESEGG
jgi:hypothetical protein